MRAATSGAASPTIAPTGLPAAVGHVLHAADDLALEALLVEVALAGDDDVGGGDGVVQIELVGDELEPGQQSTAERHERAGDAARRAGAVDLAHVDAVLVLVDLRQPLQPAGEQLDLRRLTRPSAGRTPRPRRGSGCARRRRRAASRRAGDAARGWPAARRSRRRWSPSRRGRR